MKPIAVIAASACIASTAWAGPLSDFFQNGGRADQATQIKCNAIGNAYGMAAQYRDSRLSPQSTADGLTRMLESYPDLGHQFAIKVTNLVYFDQRFAGVGGPALVEQMTVQCLDPKGKFTHPRYSQAQSTTENWKR
jgi:hypothetical protein